jgi:hypothetical protein
MAWNSDSLMFNIIYLSLKVLFEQSFFQSQYAFIKEHFIIFYFAFFSFYYLYPHYVHL